MNVKLTDDNHHFLSIIIPVYNSEQILAETVESSIACLHEYDYEIILVNDGSPDDSWKVAKKLSEEHKTVRAINLLKNYGQHTAVICGITLASGKYIVTMDDDMQNPPQEIHKLVNKIEEGYDVVFAKFLKKEHASFRILGSKFVNYLNAQIFQKPKNITLSNFRIFTSEVAKRATSYKTNYPYIPGLLLMHATSFANVETLHLKRKIGGSNYTITRIIALVSRLLINYSSYPIRIMSTLAFIGIAICFGVGTYIFLWQIISGSSVPGWSSLMIMVTILNGLNIALTSLLGIYVFRILQQSSSDKSYHIKEIVD